MVCRYQHRTGRENPAPAMFRFGDDKGQLKCSFCGKSQEQVRKLIAGPGVYICDECIELCNEIIEEELYKNVDENLRLRNIPKPKEINHILNQYVIGQERAKKSVSPRYLRRRRSRRCNPDRFPAGGRGW